ncbi:MAG: RNA-guided endonuclease IscB [Paludibacter sp.]|nr:RNA-guided endonuclease IscB [Paludibacter sp.]
MQQLQPKLKNVPTDAPQVCSSTSGGLNREETLSARGIVLGCNNLEVDQPQFHTGGLKAVVYVLSITGSPLMPCKPAKARKLIKSGKAKVIKLYPFTIKLNFECENQVQDVTLGIDSGFRNIGFSCVSEKKELISGTVILDGKTSERLTEKRMYRRGRRNHHHWYRPARFDNRKKPEDWLPPSVQRRYDTHLSLINRMKAIMPISQVIIEIANFDIQKIENPDIAGVEYQQGNMYGYQNMRSYLMAREHGLCQLCSKKFTPGNPSHIHHCKQRSEAGSSRAKNLALLHEKCHTKLHKKGLKLKPARQYKPNTFMSIIHKRFWQDVPGMRVTYGYITFLKRQEFNISKSHNNDAFVIASGTRQERCKPVIIQQKHKNGRTLQINRKGYAPAIRRKRYNIQPFDIVWINGKSNITKGCQSYGTRIYVNNTTIGIKNVEKIYNFGSLAWAI